MIIDCDTCAVRGPACGDCVVTVLLGITAPQSVDTVEPFELDDAERAALDVLADSGMVPPLRLVSLEPPASTLSATPPSRRVG